MKKLFIVALLLTASLSQAGQILKQVADGDSMVPVAVIDDFKSVSVGDKKGEISLLARLTMVYVGTAAGYDEVMLSLVDSGPSQSDYGNSYVYNLGNIVGTISNLKLEKTSTPKQYILSYKASSQKMTDDGDFKDVDASKSLKIKLDKDGSLVSVEQI